MGILTLAGCGAKDKAIFRLAPEETKLVISFKPGALITEAGLDKPGTDSLLDALDKERFIYVLM